MFLTAPPSVSLTGMQSLNEGNTLQLMCQFGGVPTPNITWSLGDRMLNSGDRISISNNGEDTSTLTIQSVRVDDAGEYKCIATNGVPDPAEDDVTVRIARNMSK